ncbi:MAG: S9 family peptidase [Blastocatellales bacterium]|nr:S9 family peptidase [Blastocatellales bacterium]
MRNRTLVLVCVIALLIPPPMFAQQHAAKKFELTVDNIMRGFDLVGYEPSAPRWSRDNRRVYFRWKRAGEPRLKEPDLYVVERDGTGLRMLSEEEARLAPPAGGDLSKDKKQTVYVEDGDIFIYDHTKGERRRITETTEGENNPRWSADGKAIVFARGGNLYRMSLEGGALVQLTDIRTGGGADPAPATLAGGGGGGGRGGFGGGFGPPRQVAGAATTAGAQRGSESQEYLKKEERALIEAVRERAERREELEARRKARETRKPFSVPAGQNVAGLALSPDGKYVVATVVQPATGAKNTIVPNYITESSYTEDIPARSKVGDAQGRSRVAIIEVASGESQWVDHGQRAAQPQGEGAGGERRPAREAPERAVQIGNIQWSEDGKHAVAHARSADNKDRWLLLVDPATGKTKVLDHLHDEAWINGPGAFTLGWLADNKRVYFQSERDGFSHLYTVSVEGGEAKQLTSGGFEVSDVRLSEDKTKFYFTSSEGSFYERHLYSMPVEGGARTRITSMPGNNQCVISPDESTLAILHSYSNKPTELYLAANRPGATGKQATTSPSEEFLSHNWIDPPIVEFKARDGAAVAARIYKSPRFQRGGPAVLFVHGAGYLQNVHKWWSSYFREYMFHHLLMERGYVVLDVDYRGSAGYGRDWRTGIYRHMGGKDLSDHVDAAKYLVSEHGVDPKRIGLYGGSYGGFITLMAMFTEPDVFAAGAALRPVTDWAHYNHGYTSNILNAPQADAEAYKRSSPIYHAEGLKGALLICHGMVDVNVHFQDTVRLVQRLIELRKENWELAAYPVEDHGFVQPASWADEYKRILKLFETNLRGGGKT